MSVHIFFWEFDADGEHANGDYDAGELEGNVIGGLFRVTPCTRIDDVRTIGTW